MHACVRACVCVGCQCTTACVCDAASWLSVLCCIAPLIPLRPRPCWQFVARALSRPLRRTPHSPQTLQHSKAQYSNFCHSSAHITAHTHTHTPPITCTAPTRVAKRRGYLWAALLIPSSGGAALAQPSSAARAPRGLQEVASAHTAPAYKFKMEGSVDGLKAKAAGDSCHHTDTDTHTQAQRHA